MADDGSDNAKMDVALDLNQQERGLLEYYAGHRKRGALHRDNVVTALRTLGQTRADLRRLRAQTKERQGTGEPSMADLLSDADHCLDRVERRALSLQDRNDGLAKETTRLARRGQQAEAELRECRAVRKGERGEADERITRLLQDGNTARAERDASRASVRDRTAELRAMRDSRDTAVVERDDALANAETFKATGMDFQRQRDAAAADRGFTPTLPCSRCSTGVAVLLMPKTEERLCPACIAAEWDAREAAGKAVADDLRRIQEEAAAVQNECRAECDRARNRQTILAGERDTAQAERRVFQDEIQDIALVLHSPADTVSPYEAVTGLGKQIEALAVERNGAFTDLFTDLAAALQAKAGLETAVTELGIERDAAQVAVTQRATTQRLAAGVIERYRTQRDNARRERDAAQVALEACRGQLQEEMEDR